MKCVLSYVDSDGCSYGYDVNLCIECESLEKLYEDFINLFRETKKKYSEYIKLVQKYEKSRKYPRNMLKPTKEELEYFVKWKENFPKHQDYNFEFLGHSFCTSGTCEDDFTFQSLEEWFEENRIN